MFLRDRDSDSRCPLMVWLEPADLSNQEKKSFQSDAGRQERADKRKADQKARKAKGKARARSWGIQFIRHDNSSDCWVLSSRMTGSIGASYPLQTELCWLWIGLTMDLRSGLNIVSLITADCIFLVVSSVVKHVTSIEFFHRCQDPCVQISYSPDELVGFLLFLCNFLVNRPKLLMWCFFCFWGELRISCRCCKADIPWDDSWRFTSERHVISPPIDKILRKAHLSLWTDHAWSGWVLLHCVSLTQCEIHNYWCLAAI